MRQTLWLVAAIAVVVAGAMPAEAQGRRGDRGDRGGGATTLSIESMTPPSAAPGATVTLRGSFPEGSAVVVGRTRVTPSSASSNRIRFVVPAGSPGPQTVTVQAGGTRASAGSLQVLPAGAQPPVAVPLPRRPPPARALVTGFAPHGGPAGTTVVIHGRRFERDTRVVFGGQEVAPLRRSSTMVAFNIPSGARSGLISLRTEGRPDVAVGPFEVDRPEPRVSRRDRRRARQAELRQQAEAAWEARQAELAATEAARQEALRQQEAEARRQQAERRAQQRAAQRARYEAAFLNDAAVKDELALHAERNAQLQRMLSLAEVTMDRPLIVRIQVLIQREIQRHERRIEDLRAVFAAR